MILLLSMDFLKSLLPLLAIIAGIFVITTKNAIISVFNLIVLYILVAFYLIFIGVNYLGLSYIIIYIGAIAILFLFIIIMIDVEVVEKKSNNYLPLLFFLLGGFLFAFKKILFNLGLIKLKSLSFKEDKVFIDSISSSFCFSSLNYENKDLGYEYYKSESEKKRDNLDLNSLNDLSHLKNSFFENGTNIFSLKNINPVSPNLFKYDSHNFISSLNFFKNSVVYSNWLENNFFFNPVKNKNKNIKDKINDFNVVENRIVDVNTNIEDNNIEFEKLSNNTKLLSHFDINPNLSMTQIKYRFDSISTGTPNYNYEYNEYRGKNYLLINSDWDSVANRLTQITGVGDILYSVYHSYIYILSVILLLGMIGAIILTADNYHEVRVINIYKKNKNNSLFMPFFLSLFIKKIFYNFIFSFFYFKNKPKSNLVIPFFYHEVNTDLFYSEGLLGNLFYFIFANILIGILLLSINSYFSLSIKYLDKGGGFECGFTSFVQTRERFNVIFYRVSLLFLIFDLEIILAFPFTAVLQKNQNIGKNNLLAFLYILIVGFIYELKEGTLNIVKKPYVTEININQN